MTDFNKIYLYRMTHIDNISHIIQNGITHRTSPNANPKYIPIGDSSLIKERNNFFLEKGNFLGNYTPFYFCSRTPMLYVIQKGYNFVNQTLAEDIVYCVTSIQKVVDAELEFVFTDGHAVDKFCSQYSIKDIDNIKNIIDWKAIEDKYWIDEKDLDKRRRKEAEFLVLGDIPYSLILGFVTYNQTAKDKLINFGSQDIHVVVKPNIRLLPKKLKFF